MINTTGVLLEAGTTCPSRSHGITQVFWLVRVAHLF